MKSNLISIFLAVLKFLPVNLAISFTNFVIKCAGRNHYFKREGNIFILYDGNAAIWFPIWIRGVKIYLGGITRRANLLAQSYYIHKIPLNSKSVIIECGANNGDLIHYYQNICGVKDQNIHAFEPSPLEFGCLEKTYKCHLNFKGLGDKVGTLNFYLDEENADSSFVDNDSHRTKIVAPVVTIKSYIEEQKITEIDLLKVEAEGFEPEIFNGCFPSKIPITYIAVDGGPERGVNQTSTIEEITNFLISHGYKLSNLSIVNNPGRALFVKPNE